jgi:hypothetical protein
VVDEAHYGFTHETESMRFYHETMKPDFTLLITATPDDANIEQFLLEILQASKRTGPYPDCIRSLTTL